MTDLLLYTPEDLEGWLAALGEAMPEVSIHVRKADAAGPAGAAGQDGVAGHDGTAGQAGPVGATGETGTAGKTGAARETSTARETGTAGEAGIPQCEYALVWEPPADLFAGQHSLKGIFSLGAGVESVLTVADLPEGVPVIRVEDAGMADQMAEYSLYAVLESFREFRRYRTAQRERRWKPHPPRDRREYPVGVLGLGVLGRAVVNTIAGLGFPVLGWSRTKRELPGVDCLHGDDGLERVLSRSRVLILQLPLTAETHGILNERRLGLLPRGACLVNLARGPLVAEAALLEALDSGGIDHAFLDVFDREPLPADHPFWTHPRVTVTPHVAAQTPIPPAARQIAEKIRRLEEGLPVTGVVDRTRGY